MEPKFNADVSRLLQSIQQQQLLFEDSLILNPVENIPFLDILAPSISFMHGLYNTDTLRSPEEKYHSKIQFSGRDQITEDIRTIYDLWAKLLGAEAISMRLLSGLHAHIVMIMGLTNIGDKVLVLPEKAGGHTSGKAILERLGLILEEIPYDCDTQRIDQELCLEQIDAFKPDIIFVDRSEGLIYEDMTWLGRSCNCYKIFDASQYLTNIICGDYRNPFDMGFDLIISTLHKNLPGPQRALICSRKNDDRWHRLRSGISTYVSNMHFYTIYSAGLLLGHFEELQTLSKKMLQNATYLEAELISAGVPAVARKSTEDEPPTHHCWIKPATQKETFDLYLILEKISILTNYRLLPYEIGYGLRLGLSGATQSGLRGKDITTLAELIMRAYKQGYSDTLKQDARSFIRMVKSTGGLHYDIQ
jgi:glycine hydroxymethyltransferase